MRRKRKESSQSSGSVSSGRDVAWLTGPVLGRVFFLAAVLLWIYWPTLRGGWIWDDGWYITGNQLLRQPDRLIKAWFEPGSWVEYYPLHETVQWIQWSLWQYDVLGYHLTNLVLHFLSALLLWRLFTRLGLRYAWLGAVLFAIHPTAVQSVAWMCELKNALVLPPFLLALLYWIDYERDSRPRDYILALVFFTLAMFCKISVAPFCAVIPLYAWYRRRLSWSTWAAAAPFFLIGLVLSELSIHASDWYQSPGQRAYPDFIVPLGGILSRLACAGQSLVAYLELSLWPFDLMPIYPHTTMNPPAWVQFWPWPVFLALLVWFWQRRETWGRSALLGSGFFVLMIAPFLGFTDVTYLSFTWVMDHFLYLPIIGLIGMAIAALGRIEQARPRWRPLGLVFVAGLAVAYIAAGRSQANVYRDERTFWMYAIEQNPKAWLALNNLGVILKRSGEYGAALPYLDRALALRPDYADAFNNKGNIYISLKQPDQAMTCYRRALQINPQHVDALNNLGTTLQFWAGDLVSARQCFQAAVQSAPLSAAAHCNLSRLLLAQGDMIGAMGEALAAARLSPDFPDAQVQLAASYRQLGQYDEAVKACRVALELRPNWVDAHNNLGLIFLDQNHFPEAIAEITRALQINPDSAEAHNNLGVVYHREGRTEEAIAEFRRAVQLKPDYLDARSNLENVSRGEHVPKK